MLKYGNKPHHTMRTYPLTPCPYCKNTFQPTRKNQVYCSTECRTDSNNEVAKQRYAKFKEGSPKLVTLAAQVRSLQTELTSASILIRDVEEIDIDTIRYGGRSYKRRSKVGRLPGVVLSQGVGVLTGDTISYRTKRATDSDSVYSYSFGR